MKSLGDRMKEYEKTFRYSLPRRMPIIIRVNGKAFHTYTKRLRKDGEPFNLDLIEAMNLTAIKLCEEIQGAQVAYVQSDEISILVHPYKKLTSEPWVSGKIDKITSLSAAIASATFTMESWRIWNPEPEYDQSMLDFIRPAYFDSRAFVLPEAEVNNYFIWRQQDAIRNSVQMLARSLFSHKQCDNKNNIELKRMCKEKGRPWEELDLPLQRGRCFVRIPHYIDTKDVIRYKWDMDMNIPIFSEDREYINEYLEVEDE